MQLDHVRPQPFGRMTSRFLATCLATVIASAEEPLPQVERLKTSPVLQHLRPNPMPSPPRTPAEQTLAQMYLPEGFRAELVVAEPDLRQKFRDGIGALQKR